ncbi:YbaB/EbfC DNA-binding family protein [Lentzea flava]|nr:YbaB/EbfC DNA-binding family protein [Lentzea flava]
MVSSPHNERVEQLKEQLQQQIVELRETQQKLREVTCTVTAPRQAVSVTVGYGGFVKEVKFPTSAYKRMAPNELSSAVFKAIADAQAQVATKSADILAPSMPAGVDVHQLFRGEADLPSVLTAELDQHAARRQTMDLRS